MGWRSKANPLAQLFFNTIGQLQRFQKGCKPEDCTFRRSGIALVADVAMPTKKKASANGTGKREAEAVIELDDPVQQPQQKNNKQPDWGFVVTLLYNEQP